MRSIFPACVSAVILSACSPFGLVDNADPSAALPDPKAIKNQDGVLALYNSSLVALSNVVAGSRKTAAGLDNGAAVSFVRLVGHVSDELDYRMLTVGTEYPFLDISTRNFDPDPVGDKSQRGFFGRLSHLRILAAHTQGGFRTYGALLPETILGHAMAIEAAALIMTAELYCSGVPLSSMEFNGDITLTRGYSTGEIYALALAKLDSASSHANADVQIASFIDVLRVRVLLGLGRLSEAAAVARRVETSFQYRIAYPKVGLDTSNGVAQTYYGKVTLADVPIDNKVDYGERIGDRKGTTGLPYTSSNDPRVTLPALRDPWAPFIMASGVEGRLVEAEAALMQGDPAWLTILNELRTSCPTSDACPTPAPAGSGGVAGLGLLADPGTADARLTLLFDERAYWLFLRGFRQGDLRRRIRMYGGSVQELYPTGLPIIGNVAYGLTVSLPVPLDEQRHNPHYKGCLNNDA